MSYEEFDWMEMLNSGKLAKQRVCTVDKYIHKHNLLAVKGKKKPQNVNAIIDHLPKAHKQTDKAPSVWRGDEALPICPSHEDFVLGEIGESSDQLSESESDSFKCCHLRQHYKEQIRNIF